MDNQNTILRNFNILFNSVLILVLMDNQNTVFERVKNNIYIGLNPCSNG